MKQCEMQHAGLKSICSPIETVYSLIFSIIIASPGDCHDLPCSLDRNRDFQDDNGSVEIPIVTDITINGQLTTTVEMYLLSTNNGKLIMM